MEIFCFFYFAMAGVISITSIFSYFLTSGIGLFTPKWFVVFLGILSGLFWPVVVAHFFYRISQRKKDV